MARKWSQNRTDDEIELDRLYLVGLLQRNQGRQKTLTAREAHKQLNKRRAALARSVAEGEGKSVEQVQAAVELSQLSYVTVSRDLVIVRQRAIIGQQLGAAALLEAQIDQVSADIEATYRRDEEILKSELGPAEYAVLIANAKLRIEQRAELRELALGIDLQRRLKTAKAEVRDKGTSAGPTRASALATLDLELERLRLGAEIAGDFPMAPEAAKLMRTQALTDANRVLNAKRALEAVDGAQARDPLAPAGQIRGARDLAPRGAHIITIQHLGPGGD